MRTDVVAFTRGDDNAGVPEFLGEVTVRVRGDGMVELGQADPWIAVSLGLLCERTADWLTVRDGLVCFTGVGPDDQPREVRYRAVGFRVAGPEPHAYGGVPPTLLELAASEGGFVLLERVA